MTKQTIFFGELNKSVLHFDKNQEISFRIYIWVEKKDGIVALDIPTAKLQGLLKQSFDKALRPRAPYLRLKSNYKKFFPHLFLIKYNKENEASFIDYMEPKDAYKYMQEHGQFEGEE